MERDNPGNLTIAYLIAGAGGMYCGSCMRDNRLAATLLQRGHDVRAIPLYTPLRTDEQDVSQRRVHYGGVGLYLAQKSRLYRSLPQFIQKIVDGRALLKLASRLAIKTEAAELGALTVAMLEQDSDIHRRQAVQLIDDLQELEPDVIHVPNLLLAALAARLKSTLGIPTVCTLAGEDVFLNELPELHRRRAVNMIREAAAEVDGFIAPTRYYASTMIECFGLRPDRVHHVPLGINVHTAESPVRPTGDPFVIGYLARISPEKGLAELVDALIRLRADGRRCELRAAGYLAAQHRRYLQDIRRRLAESGLSEQFTYTGEVDLAGKHAFLHSLDCLSVPTRYPEAKGLYVLEALSMGVPVVLPRLGSFPELVEATGGGLLYDPAQEDQPEMTIAELMDDSDRHAQLAESGRRAVASLFSADAMANAAWTVFEKYARP